MNGNVCYYNYSDEIISINDCLSVVVWVLLPLSRLTFGLGLWWVCTWVRCWGVPHIECLGSGYSWLFAIYVAVGCVTGVGCVYCILLHLCFSGCFVVLWGCVLRACEGVHVMGLISMLLFLVGVGWVVLHNGCIKSFVCGGCVFGACGSIGGVVSCLCTSLAWLMFWYGC